MKAATMEISGRGRREAGYSRVNEEDQSQGREDE
jgi:hypothetical protein